MCHGKGSAEFVLGCILPTAASTVAVLPARTPAQALWLCIWLHIYSFVVFNKMYTCVNTMYTCVKTLRYQSAPPAAGAVLPGWFGGGRTRPSSPPSCARLFGGCSWLPLPASPASPPSLLPL